MKLSSWQYGLVTTIATVLILSQASNASPLPDLEGVHHRDNVYATRDGLDTMDSNGERTREDGLEIDDRVSIWGTGMSAVELPGSQNGGRPQGWLSRWLSIGGEGEVVVQVRHHSYKDLIVSLRRRQLSASSRAIQAISHSTSFDA